MPRVLIVEDDELIAKGISTHLEAGFDPLWMATARPGSRACASSDPTSASST
jgi:DNA-binding response OmpR family regulator